MWKDDINETRPSPTERGQPVEATWLTGSGHAWVALSSDGKPIGAHLWLQHVKVDGDLATASECVLRE